ncbi:hypothetical protein, partial [Parapedomonas caeni]
MSSRREAILGALFQALDNTLDANVRRNEVLPEKVPASGLVILRDGDPGEPDVTLNPRTEFYAHRVEIEVYDPPPLNGSTLKYGFDHEGGPQWQTSDTSPTRSSRSFGRLRFC